MGMHHHDAFSGRWAFANDYTQVGTRTSGLVERGRGLIAQAFNVVLLLRRLQSDVCSWCRTKLRKEEWGDIHCEIVPCPRRGAQQSGGRAFTSAFDQSIRTETKKLVGEISDGELDMVFAFICSILRPDDLFKSGAERDYVDQELRLQVAQVVSNYDMGTIQEVWAQSGIANLSEFEDEDA